MKNHLHSKKQNVFQVFDQIAGTYDFLNSFLSLGIDKSWRLKIPQYLPNRNNLKVLDLATGTADIPILLSKDKRIDNILGLDLSKEMLEVGAKKIKRKKNGQKIELRLGDAVVIDCADESFDLVTIGFGIRNFYDYKKSLENIYRVLRPNGKIVILEFSLPKSKMIKGPYLFYFRNLLPILGKLLSKNNDAYLYLNKTVEDFPYGSDFAQALTEGGFKNVIFKPLTFGVATIYVGEKL